MKKLVKVISGGQTGADMAGLVAASRCEIETGGTAPRGYKTEKGSREYSLRRYGLTEHASAQYPPRTKKNVKDSTMTLVIAENLDTGSGLTVKLCQELNKPVLHILSSGLGIKGTRDATVKWIKEHMNDKTIINVAGNRESKSPGIESAAIDFLEAVFQRVLK